MAKIRVYELARDLSMENKALLEKLAEMKVDVKSHMSSLDDEIIECEAVLDSYSGLFSGTAS